MSRSVPRWLKRRKKTEPELEIEPPFWLGSHSNGEYFHEQTAHERRVCREIVRRCDENARRVGMERRAFMASAMGMATSLAVMNACGGSESSGEGGGGAAGAAGSGGSAGDAGVCGEFGVSDEMMFDEDVACDALGGNEFIFDIQTHHFDPDGDWVDTNPFYFQFLSALGGGDIRNFARDRYIELMFCDSDTTVAVLSTWPSSFCSPTRTTNCGLPLSNEAAAESRNVMNTRAMATERIVNHAQIIPNDESGFDRQLELMTQVHCEHGVGAWKLYPAWGPNGEGFPMDGPLGTATIEKGLELGVPLFCVHKGLPIAGFDFENNQPADIGVVARQYPEARFIIYHSAIQAGQPGAMLGSAREGPYDEADLQGTNTLIKAMLDNGIGPNENVYGELGSAYSQVAADPTAAAHFIGKLLKYCGEDNVCWGTDSILFGTPQPLIESFRMLEIPQAMQEMYGYPALTSALKAKILGLNAAAVYGIDPESKRCEIDVCSTALMKRELDEELGPRRWAAKRPLGPTTRRQFLHLVRKNRALKVPG